MSNLEVLNTRDVTPLLDVVRIVSMQDDKVLLVQEVDDVNWKLPGGKIHDGESVLEALTRELAEELGHQISVQQVESCIKAPIPDSANFRYICKVKISNDDIRATSEVAKWGWHGLDELPETKFSGHISSAVQFVA